MKHQDIVDKIEGKFGTVLRFYKILGYSRSNRVWKNKLLRYGMSEKQEKAFRELINTTGNVVLPDEVNDVIRAKIRARRKEVMEYCKKNGISKSFISNVLNNNNKRITPKLEAIIRDVLNKKQ